MAPVSTVYDGFTFDPSTAPEDSKFKVPSWVKRAPVTPAEPMTYNGLGEVSHLKSTHCLPLLTMYSFKALGLAEAFIPWY